jgi:hypothetical protein
MPVKLLLKNKTIFFAKNHCEIQVRSILVCALYSIKYSTFAFTVKTIARFVRSFLLPANYLSFKLYSGVLFRPLPFYLSEKKAL